MSLDRAAIEAGVSGDHRDPFSILGMHRNARGELIVRAFVPRADTVALVDAASGEPIADLPRQHDTGLFAGPVGRGAPPFHYRLRLNRDGRTEQVAEHSPFPPLHDSLDWHLLAEGRPLRPLENLRP